MSASLLPLIAALLYFGAGGLYLNRLLTADQDPHTQKTGIRGIAAIAVILHAFFLYSTLAAPGSLNLGLTNAVSLAGWVIAVLFLIGIWMQPIECLGALVMPLAGTSLMIAWLLPVTGSTPLSVSPLFGAHLSIALLGYAFFTLASVQGLLLMMQERNLHSHHPGRLMRALPPLETMDQLLFQLITIGFILLTLTVVSGLFFTEQIFGAPFVFNHHTVLAVIGWIVFAVLLVGRYWLGWRGSVAARWTIAGFVVLALGYFGTKFVMEILKR